MAASPENRTLERDLSLVLGTAFRIRSAESPFLDEDSLKRAYRRRAHELHPDKAVARGLDPEYLSDRFRELQEAFIRVLADLESGAYYRAWASSRETPRRAAGPSVPPKAPPRHAPPPPARASAARGPSPRPDAQAGRRGAPSRPSHAARPRPEAARIFHSGGLPRSRLRLAQYLYYTRRIDWDTLIRALAWQFRCRPKLGELGVELGYLEAAQVLEILRAKRFDEAFGAAALRTGMLDPFRLSVLLGRQRLLGLPIGRFFVDNGHIDEAGLREAVNSMLAHNRSLGARRAGAA